MSRAESIQRLVEARVVAAGRLAPADLPDFLRALEALVQEARASWPSVRVEDEAFAAHLVDALLRASPGTPLSELRAADLLLAFAASHGDPGAVRILNDRFIDRLDSPLSRVVGAQGLVADVKQILREELLVAPGAADRPNKLASFGGRGELFAWLRVVAVRIALDTRRREARTSPGGHADLADAWAPGDPESEHVRRRYRPLFKQAIAEALAGLETRDRLLLEQHHVDGLTIDDLARIYRVHRATTARWLERVREHVRRTVRESLRRRLGLDQSACDSLMGHLVADLTLTLTAERR